MHHEITIAGGGLAGLSLACGLRRHGVPVTVLEAGSYPRHRVCGEFISGVSEKTFTELGIQDLFLDANQHVSLSWHDCGHSIHKSRLKIPALGISRFRLDERLKDHATSLGAVVKTNQRVRPILRDGLIWTAGRRPCKGSWIGLKAHVRNLPRSTDLEMHVGGNGYVGLAGVEDDWINVCGLFQMDRSLRASGHELLLTYLIAGGNHALAAAIKQGELRENSFSAVAGFQLGRQVSTPGLLTLGDSESIIPPFTGNGMSMAFQAAEMAVSPLVMWSKGEQSWQKTCHIIQTSVQRKFRRRLAVANALHPLLLMSWGKSALKCLSAAHMLPFHPILSLIR